jgi:hypothetical protein
VRSSVIKTVLFCVFLAICMSDCKSNNSSLSIPDNNPPAQATVSGHSTVYSGQPNPFACAATDPDGDAVLYEFDWDGDSLADKQTGTVLSGAPVSASHAFATAGTYTVSCRAKDGSGAAGNWSNPLSIAVSEMPASAKAESPFGFFNPYEVLIDSVMLPIITRTELNGYLIDLGAKWTQGMPPQAPNSVDSALDSLMTASVDLYSRVVPTPYSIPAAIPQNLADNIQRYKDTVKYWEIDSEPDGMVVQPGQVNSWSNYPNEYATFVQVSSQTIKQTCPDCKVVLGGLTGDCTDISSTSPSVEFLRSVLNAGAAQYFDAFEFKQHHHKARDVVRLLKNKMDVYSAVFAEFGIDLRSMPIFIETANYDGTPANDNVCSFLAQSEQEQAAADVREYVYALSIGVTKIFRNEIMERYQFPEGPSGVFQYYGLINADELSSKKLSYYTYKKMVEVLNGSNWSVIQTIQESDNVYICKFIKNGNPLYVAWWDYFNDPSYTIGRTRPVSLSGLQGASAVVTETVPKFATGVDVTDYATAFNTGMLVISGGSTTLNLGENPVYVEVLQ